MKKRKISTKELVWCIISGVIWVCGFAWALTGFIGTYLKVGNAIETAEKDFASWIGFTLSFQAWGFIFLVLGTLIFTITLFHFAKKAELDAERANRRLQRLGK